MLPRRGPRSASLTCASLTCSAAEEGAAEGDGDNALLATLFPQDDGLTAPCETAGQLEGGSFSFDTTRLAKPYK